MHVIQQIRLNFQKLQDIVLPIEDVLLAYDLISQIITSYNKVAEKFYPQFSKAFHGAENMYRNLNFKLQQSSSKFWNCKSSTSSSYWSNDSHEDGSPYHGTNSDIFPHKRRFFNGRKIFLWKYPPSTVYVCSDKWIVVVYGKLMKLPPIYWSTF